MKITKIDLSKLQNEEHLQFNSEFKVLVEQYTAGALDIETLFVAYLLIFDREEEAFNQVRKSSVTDQLIDADDARDNIFSGFSKAVQASLNHYNEANKLAASRVKVLLDQYGNITRKSYDKKTADIKKMVQELQGTYATDIATLGLTEWVLQILAKNKIFEAYMKERYSEESSKTEYRMKEVRLEIDSSYRNMAEQVDALVRVKGADKYESFIKELNSRIDRYNITIAQRRGRNGKNDDSSPDTTPTND